MSVRSQINRIHAITSMLLLFSHRQLGFSSGLFPSIFPHQISVRFLLRHTRPISLQYKAPSAFIPSSSCFPGRFKYSVNISCNCHLCLHPSPCQQKPHVVEPLIIQFSPAPLQPYPPINTPKLSYNCHISDPNSYYKCAFSLHW